MITRKEYIVCWIESSQPHYRKLQRLSVPCNFMTTRQRALAAFILAADAQQEMIRGGDAYKSEQDEIALLRAAVSLCEWRAEA